MDEMKRLQQRWLDAARRHQGPSAGAARRMRRELFARIEAAEPAPSYGAVAEGSTHERRGRSWIWGMGVLLAAAALLLWASRGTRSQLARTAEPHASSYDTRRGTGRPVARKDTRATGRTSVATKLVAEAAEAESPLVEDESQSAEGQTSAQGEASGVVSPGGPSASSRGGAEADATAAGDRRKPKGAARAEAPVQGDRSPRSAAQSDQPSAPGLDVAGEAALLRRAKGAIERQQWAQAKSALDEYARAHPRGVLAPEARALRVLLACERVAPDAETQAADFLRRYPSSPLRERIRETCS